MGLPQDVLAPIVLDNLNCTGTEERLLDCPGATEPYPEYAYYYEMLAPRGGCSSVRAQFAFVECETLDGPGATVSNFRALRYDMRESNPCIWPP